MWRCLLLLALLGGFPLIGRGDVKPVLDGPDGQKAFDDLTAYYADRSKMPPYEQAMVDLGKDNDVAQHAGQYLLCLFEQSLADETNGRAESKRSPFWGGGSENPARDFRKSLAEKFGEAANGDAAIPAAVWLIDVEKQAEGPAAGIKVLRRIHSDAVTAVFAKILSQPHPNQAVLYGAIEETGTRKLTALQPQVVALENSYRLAIRDAAIAAAQQLGAPPAPDFKPENAFTPELSALLQKIADRVFTLIPADAKWMDIVYADQNSPSKRKPSRFHGWLLRTDGDDYVILDWQGQEGRLAKKSTLVTASTLAATAKELSIIRKSTSKDDLQSLSMQGGLTAQFEPAFITVPEALVAAWSFVRGDKATAAAVLFPCFDAAKDDRWIDWAARDLLGNRYHQHMLEEFSLKRDYPATLLYAQHLSKPIFDGFNYQERAKELAAQLPKRMDDFKTFVLPTPDDWAKQQAGMKRSDQIAFLAAHLRLLNCMQMMQPGGVSYADPQYAESYAELEQRAMKAKHWSADLGTKVINPYNELKTMSLTADDLQDLLPYITDDDFMPTFSYWRNFHPGRTLHRVAWPVAELVNTAAQQTLVDLNSREGLDAAGKQAALDKIKAWSAAHAGKSASDLLAETIQTTKEKRDFLRAATKAVEQKQPQLLTLAIARLNDFPDATNTIAELCFKSESHTFVDQARLWLKDADQPPAAKPSPDQDMLAQMGHSNSGPERRRFWAALILLRDGNHAKDEGLAVLQPLLAADDGTDLYPRAIPTLLASKNEKDIALACEVLKKPAILNASWDEGDQIRRLFLAGRPEARDFLLAQLKDTEPGTDTSSTTGPDGKTQTAHPPKSQNIVDSVIRWRKDNFRIDVFAPAAEQLQQREELAKWLNAQFSLIQAGKVPDMRTELTSGISQWQLDAP